MNKICFLKHSLTLLVQSGLYVFETSKYQIKVGLIYDVGNDYLIVQPDFQEGSCMAMQVVQYDKNFKELSKETYYSEDDASYYIDSLSSIKESSLNKEVLEMLNDIISFVKPTKKKVVN